MKILVKNIPGNPEKMNKKNSTMAPSSGATRRATRSTSSTSTNPRPDTTNERKDKENGQQTKKKKQTTITTTMTPTQRKKPSPDQKDKQTIDLDNTSDNSDEEPRDNDRKKPPEKQKKPDEITVSDDDETQNKEQEKDRERTYAGVTATTPLTSLDSDDEFPELKKPKKSSVISMKQTKPTKKKRYTVQEALDNAPKPYKFFFDVRTPMASYGKEDRISEITEKLDEIAKVLSSGGAMFQFMPHKNMKLPKIARFKQDQKASFFSAKQNRTKPKNVHGYINNWAYTMDHERTTLQIHAESSRPLSELFGLHYTKLLNMDFEMSPKKLSMKKTNNTTVPVAIITPGYASLDITNLVLAVHEKYDTNIWFVPAYHESSEWQQSGYKEKQEAVLCICEDNDVTKAIEIAQTEWPLAPKGSAAEYMHGIKIKAIILNDHNEIPQMLKKTAPKIEKNLRDDYNHSKFTVAEGGGKITYKLIRDIASFTTPITNKQGNTTTLRQHVLKKIEIKTGKQMIRSMCPSPTTGNKNSMFTLFTTYRSKDKEASKYIGEMAIQYIKTELAREIWETFGKEEASKVLAPAIVGNLARRNVITEKQLENIILFDIDEEDSISDIGEKGDQMSVSSAWEGNSVKTTQSTRDKLTEAQDENTELQETIESQARQMQDLMRKLQQKNSDATSEPPQPSKPKEGNDEEQDASSDGTPCGSSESMAAGQS